MEGRGNEGREPQSSQVSVTEVLPSHQVIALWLHLSENVLKLSYCFLRSIHSLQSSQANETLK